MVEARHFKFDLQVDTKKYYYRHNGLDQNRMYTPH